MDVAHLIGSIMSERLKEYLEDVELWPLPRIYPPARAAEITEIEKESGQLLEAEYRRFLTLTDGMDGFYLSMPILGCHDWRAGGRSAAALRFQEILLEDDGLADVGLPDDVKLFPVSVNADASQAIFMIDAGGDVPERFWWVGDGESQFFGTFTDLLSYVVDSSSYSPRECIS